MLFNQKQIYGITTELIVAQKFIEKGYIVSIPYGNNSRYDMVVDTETGEATASVTISNLPLGTYKVTEDTSWSWRYELTKVENNNIALGWVNNAKVLTGTASFENTRTKNKWLNFFDAVKNLFTASTPVPSEKGGSVGDV